MVLKSIAVVFTHENTFYKQMKLRGKQTSSYSAETKHSTIG